MSLQPRKKNPLQRQWDKLPAHLWFWYALHERKSRTKIPFFSLWQWGLSAKKVRQMYGHQFFIFQHCHQACLSTLHSVGWDFPSPGFRCATLKATARPRLWLFCHMEITDFREVYAVCQICESSSRQSRDCTVDGEYVKKDWCPAGLWWCN